MLARRFAFAIAILLGLAAAQAPEFAQQYRQRLGGALVELDAIVNDFTMDAVKAGLEPDAAARRLAANADSLAQARGRAMLDTIARRDRLAEQFRQMRKAGPLGRLVVLAQAFDPAVARGAWSLFEPALPLSREALVAASLAAAFGYIAVRILSFPFRRRSRAPNRRAT